MFIYQGEEIGSTNVPRSWPPEEYKDMAIQNSYREELEHRKKSGIADPDMTDVMGGINRKARDNARVPVQWDDSPHAGFTTRTPWMRVNGNYKTINVKNQENDEIHDEPAAILAYMPQALIYGGQIHGDFTLLSEEDERIFAYTRQCGTANILVVMNFSRDKVDYQLPESIKPAGAKLIAGNIPGGKEGAELGKSMELEPFEGQVWLVSG